MSSELTPLYVTPSLSMKVYPRDGRRYRYLSASTSSLGPVSCFRPI